MDPTPGKSPHPLMWIAGIAIIAFCGAGVAAIMGWIPTSLGKPDESTLTQLDKPAAAQPAPSRLQSDRDRERERDQERERARERAARNAPPPVAVAARCAECGVIQSVREIETKGTGTGIGAVGGAVVGGVLGSQVGGGDGKKVMAVVGAVGGAVAGNEIEKRVKTTKSYEITVRFDDGSSRTFTQATQPSWHGGEKVKVIGGVIQANG